MTMLTDTRTVRQHSSHAGPLCIYGESILCRAAKHVGPKHHSKGGEARLVIGSEPMTVPLRGHGCRHAGRACRPALACSAVLPSLRNGREEKMEGLVWL
jgi:hypothetical protein